jgi:hypothetical protein
LETEKSAAILVATAGRLMVIATGCIIAIVLTVLFAANGINVPRHEIGLVGAGGATAVTLIAALLTRWIKKLVKSSRDGAANDRTPDGK